MYTLVVMAALTTGGEAPDFGWKSGHNHSCYGCYGYGCYGAAYSHWGHGHSCAGCYGSWSCAGCYGGCYGSWSCWGCYGCWGTSPYAPVHYDTPKMPPADPKPGGSSAAPDRARLLVEVPADGKLFIDDQVMKATKEVRTFTTPPLQAGQTYYYILRVELAREGATLSETRRVLIRAGDEVKASFTETGIAAATKAAATASR